MKTRSLAVLNAAIDSLREERRQVEALSPKLGSDEKEQYAMLTAAIANLKEERKAAAASPKTSQSSTKNKSSPKKVKKETPLSSPEYASPRLSSSRVVSSSTKSRKAPRAVSMSPKARKTPIETSSAVSIFPEARRTPSVAMSPKSRKKSDVVSKSSKARKAHGVASMSPNTSDKPLTIDTHVAISKSRSSSTSVADRSMKKEEPLSPLDKLLNAMSADKVPPELLSSLTKTASAEFEAKSGEASENEGETTMPAINMTLSEEHQATVDAELRSFLNNPPVGSPKNADGEFPEAWNNVLSSYALKSLSKSPSAEQPARETAFSFDRSQLSMRDGPSMATIDERDSVDHADRLVQQGSVLKKVTMLDSPPITVIDSARESQIDQLLKECHSIGENSSTTTTVSLVSVLANCCGYQLHCSM